MAEDVPNLWPDDIATSDLISPVAILKKQASALGNKTDNIVTGEVHTEASGSGFWHSFFICAPTLGNYRYELFKLYHDIQLYPVHVNWGGTSHQMANQEAFIRFLAEILASPKAKRVVQSLLAQANA